MRILLIAALMAGFSLPALAQEMSPAEELVYMSEHLAEYVRNRHQILADLERQIAEVQNRLAQATPQGTFNSCKPRPMVMAVVERYGEVIIIKALPSANNNSYLEFYGNPETQTWSLLTTGPNGITCMRASGTGFGIMHPEDMTRPVGPDA